ncbi:MAG TPA: alpha/beta hydrolase, partial [Myxococcales bacterium]|nr:alpha/beta hydrolase [Myxococcales bacterium]
MAFDAPRLGALIAAAVAVVLAALFAAALAREARFARARPPPGRLAGVPGRRIHLVERPGPDPAVVFIHGNPGCSLDFVHLQDRLAGRRRSFSVDRPGSGWSERQRAPLSPQAQARLIRDALREAGA